MQRVPNVQPTPESDPAMPEAPSTLPPSGGEPRPRKPYAPDDPGLGDGQKPGSAPDIVPGPASGVLSTF